MRKCCTCKCEKEDIEFCRTTPGKRQNGRCKSCDSRASFLYRQRHPERAKENVRRAWRKMMYGLTEKQWLTMQRLGNCQCWICMGTPKTTLHVDHDHRTGQVRGLLCENCNRGLGMFKDCPELLRKAAHYLENPYRHEGTTPA